MRPLAEFGAFALALPAEAGGTGFSVVEEALLHVEFGRHLLAPSAVAAPLGARIALMTGRKDLAVQIATGETPIVAATTTGDQLLLFDTDRGCLTLVRSEEGLALLDLTGTALEAATAMGHGRPLSRLRKAAPGRSMVADAATAMTGDLLVSAQLLGVATAARDLAVTYAKVRTQFGRPIGGFQAVKHHCANMAVAVEKLSALLDMAAIAVRDECDDAAFQTAALARLAPRIALANARLCIQIHGGIGFSAEASPQLYLKHAHLLRHLLTGGRILDHDATLAPIRREKTCVSP
jgi:alkylation response protein AidB-like acyl-CoA dehydrogenase